MLAALLAAVTASTTPAALFDYSYTYENGLVVSGSFEGTQRGDEIESVTNISVAFDGTPIPGPWVVSSFSYPAGWQLGGGRVSFDAAKNNFLIENPGPSAGFYMLDLSLLYGIAFSQTYAVDLNSGTWGFDSEVHPERWSITARAVPVPEAGAALALFGPAAFLLGLIRRRAAPATA